MITGIRRWIAARRWGILTAAVIALAMIVRVGLVAAGWPGTDSDDATMGLMAKHIVALGERPIFFYGQSYMGSIEAYAAALVFLLLGASEFALKCGLILLYVCFMAIMYGFLVQITSRAWALVGEALLALGADEMLYHQLEAYGGYLETLIFGAALLALTCWLIRTQRDATLTRRRYLALAGWGLAAGLGLWSDVLVAPFVVLTAGALALFCWPTVRRWGAVLALSCLLLGLSPWIIYLATPAPSAPRGLIQSGTALPASPVVGPEPSVIETATNQFLGMALISLPNETGATTLCPLTPSEAWPQDHWTTPRIQQCIGFRAVWGGSLLCLLTLGLILETRDVLRLRRRPSAGWSTQERADLAQSASRLLGLAAPAVTIALYTLSSASAFAPWIYSRYLISVSIALPTLLASLWAHVAERAKETSAVGATASPSQGRLAGAHWLARAGVFGLSAILLVALALGTVGTYRAIDAQQEQNQVRVDLVAYLTQHGHTRVYTEFWTCYWVIFQSDERVICGVLNADWSHRPSRYAAYDDAIAAAAPSTYVFPLHSTWTDTFEDVAVQRRWRIEQKTIIDQQYAVFVVAPLSP
ncbi:MAG TPA: hypothetical protein VH349_13505 [Ktedonobacterales bacterium]